LFFSATPPPSPQKKPNTKKSPKKPKQIKEKKQKKTKMLSDMQVDYPS
jgi:hypothetical protein